MWAPGVKLVSRGELCPLGVKFIPWGLRPSSQLKNAFQKTDLRLWTHVCTLIRCLLFGENTSKIITLVPDENSTCRDKAESVNSKRSSFPDTWKWNISYSHEACQEGPSKNRGEKTGRTFQCRHPNYRPSKCQQNDLNCHLHLSPPDSPRRGWASLPESNEIQLGAPRRG
jgi:hypothetical protein